MWNSPCALILMSLMNTKDITSAAALILGSRLEALSPSVKQEIWPAKVNFILATQ